MDAYDTYYVLIQRSMMFLGIWPYQDPMEKFVRTILVSSIILSLMVVEILTCIAMDLTLEGMVELLTVVIPTFTFSGAYFAILAHFDDIKLTFDRMTYDWSHLNDLEELEIMRAYADEMRRYMLIFAAIMYGTCFCIVTPSLFSSFLYNVGVISDFDDLHLPVDLEYFLDKNKYFYIMMFHQVITVVVMFTCAFASYSMFFMMIQHACASFRIISTPQNTDKWISCCIKRYTNVIEFVDTTNKSGEMCYLWQISLSMVLVSLAIVHVFRMSSHFNSMTEWFYNISCIPGPIVSTYVACYVGQRLINHSVEVFLAATQLSYYDTSIKMQKLLLFLLMRTAKPCTLSIGKMFIFSHEFFSAAIQSSFSYAMMLYTFQ